MRRFRLSLYLLPLLAVAAAPAPSLKLFAGSPFEPGLWQMTPLDADTQAKMPNGQAQCLFDPSMLLHAGQAASDMQCGHTVVEDNADRATVTYVCKGHGYGRTSIRRDGGNFTIDAQGIAGREPFEMRGEYKRVGACPDGGR